MRMIFAFFGVKASEKEIAKACGSSKNIGTPAKGLLKAAKKYGFLARVKDNSSISDIRGCLRRGVPAIVNWFSIDDGHYSVVTGMDRKHIYLNDPEKARKRKLELTKFENCWFDFAAGKRPGKKSLIVRRMIIIEKQD